ncbi:MAG: metallophosphoesterase family protein [Syntrophorhabdales bacterium]
MTKVGVLSDTHLTALTREFKSMVSTLFRDVEIIIHAGDIVTREVYGYLCNWDVRAVLGNMDSFDLAGLLPNKRVEVIEGRRIGIIHGKGPPYCVEQLVISEFTDVDLIVFGHSHVATCSERGGVLLFNPGAVKNPASGTPTVGIIEIGEKMRFKHLPVK